MRILVIRDLLDVVLCRGLCRPDDSRVYSLGLLDSCYL